jgi:hypothetical protein
MSSSDAIGLRGAAIIEEAHLDDYQKAVKPN